MEPADHPFRNIDLEAEFGPSLERHDGCGLLKRPDGGATDCKFSALLLRRGIPLVLTYCPFNSQTAGVLNSSNSLLELEGATFDGLRVEASGLDDGLMLPQQGQPFAQSGWYSSRRANEVRIILSPMGGASGELCFGLTNLSLPRTPVEIEVAGLAVTLSRVEDFDNRIARLAALREVDVTAVLRCRTGNLPTSMDLVDEICDLLSLAQGSRVTRTFCESLSLDREKLETRYWQRRTSRFTALSTIELGKEGQIQAYLAAGLPAYRERAKRWNLRALVAAFLDTKNEQDAIQSRAVKMAVVIEMLKAEFIKAESPVATILPDGEWDRLCKEFKRVVKENCSAKDSRAKLYENLSGVNRKPFRDLLMELCHHLDWHPEETELKRFVDSRNSLVHNGRFRCEERGSGTDLRSRMEDEYFFLVSFLDRLFLRLVGYDDPYTPWRQR